MAEAVSHELIIIKRGDEEEHEHHSSAWKVAHADFMTAMMAFFLIMWLINVTDEEIRKGIAQYFNPIHLSEGLTELKGINKPKAGQEKKSGKRGFKDSVEEAFNPMKLSEGLAEAKELQESEEAAGGAEAEVAEQDGHEAATSEAPEPASGSGSAGPAPEPTDGDQAVLERAAFEDPYAVLAELAREYAAEHARSVDVVGADERPIGMAGGEVDRDPFDPSYWQLTQTPPARATHPGEPGSAQMVDEKALPDATTALNKDTAMADPGAADGEPDAATSDAVADHAAAAPPAIPPAPPPAVDVAHAPPEQPPAVVEAAGATENAAEIVAESAEAAGQALAAEIAAAVESTMSTDAAPQLSVQATSEGILINLTDDADFSMFDVGSAIPKSKVVVLMERIAGVLEGQEGEVVVRGHTDGRPFRSEAYDNWRLSAARAHMAYYMLTRGGLAESRVVTIEGYADRSLKNPSEPYAAENRRIEILLREAK